MTHDADVYQNDQLVAYFDRTPHGLRFSYSDTGRFLATHLPHEDFECADLPTFFLNLLPEGARFQLLMDSLRAKDDQLSLLLKVGWDTVGDISVRPHGENGSQEPAINRFTHVGEVSFWDVFYASVGERPDAAIPGVQEKVSASTVAFPVRFRTTQSASLKLNPKKHPFLVANESFFLDLARTCGIRVNKANVVVDRDGEPGLLVARFDRVKQGRTVRKLHQEDGCQLLDALPARKYDPSMRAIADAVAAVCSSPVVEVARLLRIYAFSYLIGNCDMHAKNVSVLWDATITLTPAYDLLSTLPYPEHDRHMALRLDGKDDDFRVGDLIAFGHRYDIPEPVIRSMVNQLCDRVEANLNRLDTIGFDAEATDRLRRDIAERITRLRR